MKKFTFMLTILAMMTTIIGNTLSAQKIDSGEKKYHLKIEKIENGKKVKLDTVVTSDEPFTWNGETINPGQSTMTMSSGDASMKKFSYTIDQVDDADIIVLNKGKEDSDSLEVVVEANVDITGDAMKNHTVHVWSDEEGHTWKFAPEMVVPDENHMIIFDEDLHGKNVIDLSDPGIISYKKKVLKDGTEKITIVRKQTQDSKESGETIKTDGKFYRIKETGDEKNKEIEVEVEVENNGNE